MNKWARNIHLAVGVLATPFLLVYAFSAIQMAHPKWFSLKRTVTKSRVEIPASEAPDGRTLARQLMTRANVQGELTSIDAAKSGYRVHVARPGAVFDIVYDSTLGKAEITETKSDTVFLLNRLHHLAGVDHQYGWLNIWGWTVCLISILLFTLSATGIYLWFRIHGEIVVGLILLTTSLSYSIVLLFALRVT